MANLTTNSSDVASEISDNSTPVLMDGSKLDVIIKGYVMPTVVLLTVLTNGIVCVILLQPGMRNTTNALLVAMAVSDTLTGLMPLPHYLHFYVGGDRYRDWVPYNWCATMATFTEHLPTAFHTASIWLTVALAVQRYIHVCQVNNTAVHQLNTKSYTTVLIVAIYAVALISQLYRLIEIDNVPMSYPSLMTSSSSTSDSRNPTTSQLLLLTDESAQPTPFREAAVTVATSHSYEYDVKANSTLIVGCRHQRYAWLLKHQNLYYNIYFGCRVVAIHLVPCVTLVVMNGLLVRTMRKAKRRRDELRARCVLLNERRRLTASNVTTRMLVIVVAVFLLVEFPLAVLMILLMVHNTFKLPIIGTEAKQAALVINATITFSYPVNFFIYCAMSRKFRDTMLAVFCRRNNQPCDGTTTTRTFRMAMETITTPAAAGKPTRRYASTAM